MSATGLVLPENAADILFLKPIQLTAASHRQLFLWLAEGFFRYRRAVQRLPAAATRLDQHQHNPYDKDGHQGRIKVTLKLFAGLVRQWPEDRLDSEHSSRQRGNRDEAHGDECHPGILRFSHVNEEGRTHSECYGCQQLVSRAKQ